MEEIYYRIKYEDGNSKVFKGDIDDFIDANADPKISVEKITEEEYIKESSEESFTTASVGYIYNEPDDPYTDESRMKLTILIQVLQNVRSEVSIETLDGYYNWVMKK